MAERRQRIDSIGVDKFIDLLTQMQLEVDEQSSNRAFAEVLKLARAHRLTSYDAVYLDLAQRRQLPLATLDEELRTAASTLGFSFWASRRLRLGQIGHRYSLFAAL